MSRAVRSRRRRRVEAGQVLDADLRSVFSAAQAAARFLPPPSYVAGSRGRELTRALVKAVKEAERRAVYGVVVSIDGKEQPT